MQASCQCTLLTFLTPTLTPQRVYVCHCTQCRAQSGSAFGISAIFPYFDLSAALSPSQRQHLKEYSRPTESGKTMRCFFCAECGSRLMHVRDGVGSVSVKGGVLKGLTREMVRGAVHIWTKEAVVDVPVGCQQWEEEPGDDD